jgi:hypothetical protein
LDGDKERMLDFIKKGFFEHHELKKRLDMHDPIDHEIFMLSKNNKLSVEFCQLEQDKLTQQKPNFTK